MFVEKRAVVHTQAIADLTGYSWCSDFSVSVEELGIERAILTQTYKREEAVQKRGFVGGPGLDLKPQAAALRKLLDMQHPAPGHSGGCHQPLGYPVCFVYLF